MGNCIVTENLTYRYPAGESGSESTALDSVSLTIAKGEFVAVLGHNGSGKSTLARQLNALISPTCGKVYINGMDTSKEELQYEIRKAAGMVFQNLDNQLVASVVEDDVAFGPENIGMDPLLMRERVDNALEAVGMQSFADKSPNQLSGGQKQRIAIAGVLALKPEIIILDEPTAMLDPVGRREILSTIEKLSQEGITIILITHFMQEAARAGRVVVMNDGHILMDGTPQEIFARREELLEVGLELPATQELRYQLHIRGIDISDDAKDYEGMAEAICRLFLKM